jgi:hypothetical protein
VDLALVIIWTQYPVPGGQQLQLGPSGNHPLAGVEHVSHVATVSGDSGNSDQRPAVQVKVPGLGYRDVEAPTELRDHRPDQRALLLQGVNVTEQDVQLHSADVHRSPPVW